MSTDDSTDDDNRHPYESDESFHPMGKEWEDRMRDEIEDTEFDADLGMEMAKDAQRLVAGELSEAEFYSRYHDDVEEEFDVDERPVLDDLSDEELEDLEDDGSMLEALQDIDLEAEDVSRRDMMKKMGAGAAFLGYGVFASTQDEESDIPQDSKELSPVGPDERDARWGMVIDLERCDGCLSCVAGCIDENGTSTGANWMYVFTYDDPDKPQENFLVRPCQHCSNAPCAKVCPVRARHNRDKDGIVLTDYEVCIGCRYCQVACPYGVNYFQWGEPDVPMSELEHTDMTPKEIQSKPPEERQQILSENNDHVYDKNGRWTDSRPPKGTMGKCTMCPSRQDGHTDNPRGTVACQDACDTAGMSAIHFGDLDDPESRPRRYLRKRADQDFERSNQFEDPEEEMESSVTTWGSLSAWKLLEEMGTKPNITYLGPKPGEQAEQVPPEEVRNREDSHVNPVSYEQLSSKWDVEVKDNRKEHLDYVMGRGHGGGAEGEEAGH